MKTCITNGIKVSVVSKFEPAHSSRKDGKYVHSYSIAIENKSNETVQLLSRHWIIVDSDLNIREVKGEGVVGQQPVLRPGESHQYSSWCPLATDLGKMQGTYQMITGDDHHFDVVVPSFILCDNARLN